MVNAVVAPAARSDRLRTVCLVSREEVGVTGTSRYTDRLAAGLTNSGLEVVHHSTRPSGAVARWLGGARRVGVDANTFLALYPLRLRWPRADVYHLTVQNHASVLLASPPPGPVVVTVHDIGPFVFRSDASLAGYSSGAQRLFDRLAMRGLRRATRIVCDSEWTEDTLVRVLGLPGDRIDVAPLGVDLETYRPSAVPPAFRERYGLRGDARYLLYVGSEDPRKNLEVLWRALPLIVQRHPEAILLKVGYPRDDATTARLSGLASELRIADRIRSYEGVPESDLPFFYNTADVLLIPSLYEGFGLTALEAMASGTAVVTSGRTALAELAREGGAIVADPNSPESVAGAVIELLDDHHLRESVAASGLTTARRFTWNRMVEVTVGAYRKALEAEDAGVRGDDIVDPEGTPT